MIQTAEQVLDMLADDSLVIGTVGGVYCPWGCGARFDYPGNSLPYPKCEKCGKPIKVEVVSFAVCVVV